MSLSATNIENQTISAFPGELPIQACKRVLGDEKSRSDRTFTVLDADRKELAVFKIPANKSFFEGVEKVILLYPNQCPLEVLRCSGDLGARNYTRRFIGLNQDGSEQDIFCLSANSGLFPLALRVVQNRKKGIDFWEPPKDKPMSPGGDLSWGLGAAVTVAALLSFAMYKFRTS